MSGIRTGCRAAPAILLACLCAAPGLSTTVENPGCVDDVTERFFPNRVPTNCTANDVTFVLVGLGTQSDGCVNGAGDGLTILLRAILQNTTATTRYDVGMYVATDGGDARRGGCAREELNPVGGVGVISCGVGALDLDGPLSGVDLNVVGVGDGPYLTAETGSSNSTPDQCGDLFTQAQSGCDEGGDGLWDDSTVDFDSPVTVPCRDPEDNGFVNLPTCATWGNQADEVHSDAAGDDTCDSEAELIPGTKAKCRCEDFNSDVPQANLSCSVACTPTLIQPGETTSCTVTYTNAQPTGCTPDPGTPERFRCGTSGFIRFKTDLSPDDSFGSFSNVSPTCLMGGCSAAAIDTDSPPDGDDDQVLWTPDSGNGTAAIIGPGESSTLSFDYTLDAGGPPSQPTLTFTTTGYWADDSSFTGEVAQTTLTCGDTITTPVRLASFTARRRGATTLAEWSTATEIGNLGFNLYEELEDGWRRVNEELIPSQATDSAAPLHYRFEFESLGEGPLFIESLDVDGSKHLHGPFSLGKTHGVRPQPEAVDWPAVRAESRGVARRSRRGKGAADGPAVNLLVDRDGLFRATYEGLAAAGFDFIDVPVAHLALLNRGNPVAIRVEPGEGSGARRFGPGGFVEFYGEALDTLYTSTNVYRLEVAPASAKRVAVDRRSAKGEAPESYQETARVERNRGYSFGSPTEDPWYDTRMLTFENPRQWAFELEVEDLVAGSAPSRLTVDLWGSTSWPPAPDHHVRALLNGVQLADELFDGRVPHTIAVEIPPGVLIDGTNTLILELPGDQGVDFDLVNLERYTLTYPRAFRARQDGLHFRSVGSRFEVAGLASADLVAYRLEAGGPVRLAGLEIRPDGGSFTASLRGSASSVGYVIAPVEALPEPGFGAVRAAVDITSGDAEYLAISHANFLDALTPLVTLHESEGLSVKVVDVADVYSQFGDDIFDPDAIRAYIAHAASQMNTRTVLLVGADTFDYQDYLGIGSISFVPTLYAPTGDIITFAPVDPLYTDLDGDLVPDLPIGRLPVRTVAELESLVARTLEYAAKGYGRTGVFAADEFDARARASFTRDSEEFLAGLEPGWVAHRAYLDRLDLPAARDLLIQKMNEGAALTSFVGHSGPTAWTFAGLFTSADAAELDNAGQPTVVVQWGCWNTYHVEPRFQTLGHAFLLSGNRGAAAVMGSATLLETSSARELSRLLAPELAKPGVSLGEALTAAKQQLEADRPDLLDVLLGWTILGDPGLFIEP